MNITDLQRESAQEASEPVGWLVDAYPYMVLNHDERHLFVTDKTYLSDYIGTEEEPSGYKITPLYTSPPNTQELEAKLNELVKFQSSADKLAEAQVGMINHVAELQAKLDKAREALELAKITFIANKMDVRNVMEIINEALKEIE
jgi:hypothetical protein